MRQTVELSVHHMEHALINNLMLIFDGREHALVEGEMNWHINLLLSSRITSAHLDLFLITCVLIDDASKFVPNGNLRCIKLSLLPLLVGIFDLGVLLPQIPDSPLMCFVSVLVNGAPYVIHQGLCKSSTNYVHGFT